MERKINIRSCTAEELQDIITSLGEKKYRAAQIFKWLQGGAESFDDMTDIPLSFRAKLNDLYRIDNLKIEKKLVSSIDGTIKYLFRLYDGNFIETVLMRYKHGNTICVSTQVGCSMGCRFCASTIGGKIRNLETGEITDQVIKAGKDSGLKISNIVMMGMGQTVSKVLYIDPKNTILLLKNHHKYVIIKSIKLSHIKVFWQS